MLLIVCPNLALDRILEVENFRASTVQRTARVIVQPGGKGSNAARVFRRLGGDVMLAGFVGRRTASAVREPLESIGVSLKVIEAYETNRTCTIIVDPRDGGCPTVINEESPVLEEGVEEHFIRMIADLLPQSSAVFITGSLARGLDPDAYRCILEQAKALKIFTVVDATGDALRSAVRSAPTLLKVNSAEFAELVGMSDAHPDRILDALRRTHYADQTVVTLGEAGALMKADGALFFASHSPITPSNSIGAGDSFGAGYISEFLRSGNVENALRHAMAAAINDVLTIRPGDVDPISVRRFVESVQIERL